MTYHRTPGVRKGCSSQFCAAALGQAKPCPTIKKANTGPKMEIPSQSTSAKWTVPQCGFTIEYTPLVIDDIRLAVVDAFFSLPRGGAEIGGILLGTYEKGR